jgi:ADP-L-glycero-D-manno-heptose 6-epimerase
MFIVTGGAGFIGSNIVKGLNDRGITDILVVDDLGGDEKYRNLVGLRYSDYYHKDEFLAAVAARKFKTSKVEAILHQGACSDTMEYNCNYMMTNNYEYSKSLLHFSLEQAIPFLYASSASTYGNGTNGFREEEACEEALNPYAFSKLSFDRYLRLLLPRIGSPVIGLKYFNVFGPQEHHKGRMASIVYQLYNQLKDNGFVKLFKGTDGYGDGEQKRDFIYVKDVVKVNLHFFEHGGPSGIYNCGTGKATTFNAVADAVIRAYGVGRIEYIDFPDILKGKYQNFTEADPRKLRQAGYQMEFPTIEATVGDYVRSLKETGGYYRL